ncbi:MULTISPECIES: hypothetical protein [unclassified Microbulbifer]|uniref:leucine-rich repeat domain-containing protein n=1 Tax=unclassified Microbulbifer TaxID=2619833 RepID=UPI0027E480DD|nr:MULTISPECIES: hypothetical protein [unclassified Microbulbifer]
MNAFAMLPSTFSCRPSPVLPCAAVAERANVMTRILTRGFPLAVLMVFLAPMAWAQEFGLADPHFADCVTRLAKKNGWTSADQVTAIRCHGEAIEDLAGLAGFTNLKSLSLHKNNIAHAQLPPLEKLETLNLARNRLQSLELAELPSLATLYLFGNELESLSLKNLPQLKLLKANNNKLQVFHYENLPKLNKIYIFDNQIEHVDIHSLPAMTYMDCRQNPMPDPLYEEMDKMGHVTFLHDGNADDW